MFGEYLKNVFFPKLMIVLRISNEWYSINGTVNANVWKIDINLRSDIICIRVQCCWNN